MVAGEHAVWPVCAHGLIVYGSSELSATHEAGALRVENHAYRATAAHARQSAEGGRS